MRERPLQPRLKRGRSEGGASDERPLPASGRHEPPQEAPALAQRLFAPFQGRIGKEVTPIGFRPSGRAFAPACRASSGLCAHSGGGPARARIAPTTIQLRAHNSGEMRADYT